WMSMSEALRSRVASQLWVEPARVKALVTRVAWKEALVFMAAMPPVRVRDVRCWFWPKVMELVLRIMLRGAVVVGPASVRKVAWLAWLVKVVLKDQFCGPESWKVPVLTTSPELEKEPALLKRPELVKAPVTWTGPMPVIVPVLLRPALGEKKPL